MHRQSRTGASVALILPYCQGGMVPGAETGKGEGEESELARHLFQVAPSGHIFRQHLHAAAPLP